MKIRGQHYVWRFYLEPWVGQTGQLFCRRNGKIFLVNPKSIAKQRDFYHLRELTQADLELIKKIVIDPSPDHLKPLHNNLLSSFSLIPELKVKADTIFPKDDGIRKVLDEAVINSEELLHGSIEHIAIKHIKCLRAGDTDFYQNDNDAMSFLFFLCVQYMRTKRIREAVLLNFAESPPNLLLAIDRIWNILSHIFATNMAWSLYAERNKFRLVLLQNEHTIQLLTGDQPIVNTLGTNDGAPPAELEFYYPVTPNLAILLTERMDITDSYLMTPKDVETYNNLICRNSHEQIYSNCEAQLRDENSPVLKK